MLTEDVDLSVLDLGAPSPLTVVLTDVPILFQPPTNFSRILVTARSIPYVDPSSF